jgi:hypothetical protein
MLPRFSGVDMVFSQSLQLLIKAPTIPDLKIDVTRTNLLYFRGLMCLLWSNLGGECLLCVVSNPREGCALLWLKGF